MDVATAREADIRFTMTFRPQPDFLSALIRIADADLPGSDHLSLVDVVELGLEKPPHSSDVHVKIHVDASPA